MYMLINDRWQADNRKQRVLAAVFAMLLTLMLAKQFSGNRLWSQRTEAEQPGSVQYLSLFNLPIPSARQPENHENAAARIPTGDAGRKGKSNSAPAARAVLPASDSGQTSTPVEAAPEIPPPATGSNENGDTINSTLKVDSKAITKAYKDSRTDMQKMADATGKTLANPESTKMQQFDVAMKEAAVPGCLAKGEDPLKHNPAKLGNVSFSGLLALPFYVTAIAKGKCK
ncbi:hypothetical protein [Undibacterium terreum]|uniref:Uncharacterized protein n=1 Tax=Undibacterium terreum TaxID=1224302 RepID=A0A916UDS3_9BURK|nr:hypothetical protein [Undibacterium terreum]GGC69917.1 hypothetical protein GCM10011396_16170 [Undibacterium terreum]